jgi:hypothetical protein
VTAMISGCDMAIYPRIGRSLGSRRLEEASKDSHLRAQCVALVSLSYVT